MEHLVGILIGVGVATLSFLVKEVVSSYGAARRFRARFLAKLRYDLTSFHQYLADLDQRVEDLEAFLDGDTNMNPGLNLIWDVGTDKDMGPMVHENHGHLTIAEFQLALDYVGGEVRLDQILGCYNQAVLKAASAKANEANGAHELECDLRVVLACLKDITTEYLGLLSDGLGLLQEFQRRFGVSRLSPAEEIAFREIENRAVKRRGLSQNSSLQGTARSAPEA